jgi:hypothetical protein
MLCTAEQKFLISLKLQQGYMLIVFIWTQPHWKILVTKYTLLDSMFCWPCISIHPCNENQLDAIFILRLFHQYISICFEHICSPSWGGILYTHVYATIGTCCAFQLTVCCPSWDGTRTTDSQLKSTICTNRCIYTV